MNDGMTGTNRKNRPKNPLEKRVFISGLVGSFLLGLVLLLIFLGFYAWALSGQYVAEAFTAARTTRAAIQNSVENTDLIREVTRIYDELSEEEKLQTGQKEYNDRFQSLYDMPDYKIMESIIRHECEAMSLKDIYVAVFDRQRNAMIYVCDPADESTTDFPAGNWEYVEKREVDKFCTWNGEGRLYDVSYTSSYGFMCTAGVPVYYDDLEENRFVGFVMSDIMLTDLMRGVLSFALKCIAGLLIATVGIGIFISRRMRKTFVDPINQIAAAAARYVEDRRSGISRNDHFDDLAGGSGDELDNLCQVMAEMEKGLNEVEENMTRITAEKERIATELDLAAKIQIDALPQESDMFSGNDVFDLYASMDPARQIGGDFYDFFKVDDDHLALVIADVSGKGIPASLFMMASKIVISDNAKMGRSPSEIMEAANEAICHNNFEKMFVTAWIGILELSSGRMKAANAGHEYPYLTNEEGVFEKLKDRHGFVLGAIETMKYSEYEFVMRPGTKLFVYTDGLPEAENSAQEMFGSERMLASLNHHASMSPKEILAGVHADADAFCGDAEQSDDLTMLCLEYKGDLQKMNVREMSFAAKLEEIPNATAFADQFLEEAECSLKAQMQIDIAIDELLSNIVHYAYQQGEGTMTLRCENKDADTVRITFIDQGIPFDPLQSALPDIMADAESREAGGLGIYLVRKTMDNMYYSYENGQNILTIEKRIHP